MTVPDDNSIKAIELDDQEAFREWMHHQRLSAKAAPRDAKSLLVLRDQMNKAYPDRKKDSDGTIGDAKHCAGGGNSDHCPHVKDGDIGVVTALDITHDPAHGCDMNKVSESIVSSKDQRIKYVIWNKKICASYIVDGIPAWTWRSYGGPSPHDKHAHFSVLSEKDKYDNQRLWEIG